MAVDSVSRVEGRAALVTLVRADVPMTAASIALQLAAEFEFRDVGLCTGDRVRFDGNTLLLGPTAAGARIVADAGEAAAYEGAVVHLDCCGAEWALPFILAAARGHRESAVGRSSFTRAAVQKCDALLGELVRHGMVGNGPAVERCARALIGLGPGLTPSGDDTLCGFMLGRAVAGSSDGATDDAVRSAIREADGRTTDFSAVQLALAAHGRFGEALLDVAEALATGGRRRVRAAVARCLGQGATSGADALLGFVAGVRSVAITRRIENAG